MKKVLKWAGIGLLAFIVLGIIAVASDDGTATAAESTTSAKPAEISYNIAKEEETRGDWYFRVVINDRYEKKDVIEILRKIRKEKNAKEKVVAWFYIRKFSESGAWAWVAYLTECESCKEEDQDGTPVQFERMGLSASKADSLRSLTLDTIDNKKLVASYLEDISKCKTEIYEVDGNPKRLLMAQLYEPGPEGRILKWLRLKEENGEDRYYFEDETDGEGNYMINEWGVKTVHFRNKEGKEWLTFGYE